MTRTVLLVAVLVASTALFVSTGAFPLSDGTDQLDDVDVVMEPADGPNGKYAVINENEEIELLLTEENPDLDGSGIAGDTVTPIHRVFTITNNGTETARVWISDDADDVRFYRDDSPENRLEGPENEFELAPDETIGVGLLVDTRGDHDVANVSQFTVHVEQGTPTPEDSDGTDGDENGVNDGAASDTNPPAVSAFEATNPEDQNVSISFDSSEPLSSINVTLRGPENTTLTEDDFAYDSANGTYTATYDASSDGTYTVTLHTAVDAAGNDGATGQSDQVTIDTTAPTIPDDSFTVTNPEDQNVSVSFNSTEELANISIDLSGPENATLTEDDVTEANGTYTATYDGSSDGTYNATLKTAEDEAGNDGATGQSGQVTVDTTGPTVTIFEPTDGESYDSGDVPLNVSADQPVSNWSYSINGSTSQSFSPNTTLTGLSEGQHTVTVYAEDDAGNVGSETADFTVDTTAPTIPDGSFTVTNPERQNVVVTFNTTEPLSSINVTLRGPENATLTEDDFAYDSANGTYATTYLGSSDGRYNAILNTAEDSAGNDGATGQFDTVTVDTIPPAVSAFEATNPEGQNVSVSFNSTEELAIINVTLRGQENTTLTEDEFAYDSANGTYTATYDVSSDGTYTATLHTAVDAAGNDGAEGQIDTVEVDTAGTDDGDETGGVAEIGGFEVTTLLGALLPLALLLFLLAVYRRRRDEE